MGICQQYATIWPASEQDTSQAVCEAESHDNPTAECLNCARDSQGNVIIEDSIGLWEINLDAHPEFVGWNLKDPATNARAALQVWQSSGWGAWSTFTNGDYKKYLTGAQPSSGSSPAAPPTKDYAWLVPALIGAVVILAIT